MTVYVDELRQYPKGPVSLRRFGSCHMLADTADELHALADRIGLQRWWFQDGAHPHYDLSAKFRHKAVRAGAVELSNHEMAAILPIGQSQ